MSRHFVTFVLAAAVCVGAMGCASAHSSSEDGKVEENTSSSCRVGSKPRMDIVRVPAGSGVKLRSRILVIGCGTSPAGAGLVELVGYRTSEGFCYAVDMPKLARSEGGLCAPPSAGWKTICGGESVCANGAISFTVNGSRLTQVSGQFDPHIRDLSVNEGKRPSVIVVDQVPNRLRKELGMQSSIAFFAAVVQGCLRSGIDLKWSDGEEHRLTAERIAPEGCQG